MSSKKQWNDDLPDTGTWQPREDANETLARAFLKRCQGIEQKILLLSELERKMNVDNFDSGLGIEDIIREELSELCPRRYSVRAGVIDDSKGRTAGDFEIIIANDTWFTPIKSGATKGSRRFHFPIEAVYAVIEVKQTLTYKVLDEAMEKLVKCHRLDRPITTGNSMTENCKLSFFEPVPNLPKNTLYSAIIATGLGRGIKVEDIARRFRVISKTLKPEDQVRSICVLGQGTIGWGYRAADSSKSFRPFLHDLDETSKLLVYGPHQGAFYSWVTSLLRHLFNSILDPAHFISSYGLGMFDVEVFDD